MNATSTRSIEIRELKAEEWPKILETGTLDEKTCPAPEASRCFAAFEDGEITAYWFVQLAACCEPVWVHPDKRSGSLGFHLYNEVMSSMKAANVHGYLIHSNSAEVSSYLKRLGLTETGYTTFAGSIP